MRCCHVHQFYFFIINIRNESRHLMNFFIRWGNNFDDVPQL